ncbi:chitinase [Flavobacterium sp. L1I52]|uniref:chitinase n=2 Tax=Flavobacterium pokkalii TaxID=1940408 RepID=A0ABR7UQJ6_9FLAO|nr:chitinase [Flavobacterium pokkalii]
MIPFNVNKKHNKRMKLSLYIVIISCFFACSSLDTKKKNEPKNSKIIGYVAGYEDFDPAKVDATKLTHVNYAFANIVNGNVQFELATDDAKIKALMGLKKQNPSLKVLFSIGGWVWSDQFSNVAAYQNSREQFAKSAVQLMKKYGFDGIDIDWEFPGQRAEDNVFRPSDKDNFTLLLAELRKQLEIQTTSDKVHYLLSIASGADQNYLDHTDLKAAQKCLDYINIMGYDFYNGWMYQTGHHANLNASKFEKFGGDNLTKTVDAYLKTGITADKIVVGIPFYGRKWSKVNPQNNGLYQSAQTGAEIIAYWKIKEEIATGKYKQLYDESAKASYLWNEKDGIFISYETPNEIELKANFIKTKGLGGAMFWEYSLDSKQELLDTLFENMKK